MDQSGIKHIFADVLSKGKSVRVTALGVSMVPFLWPHSHLLVMPCQPSQLVRGDVALFDNMGDSFVAHRVIDNSGSAILFRGDSCMRADGWIAYDRVVGKVTKATVCGITFSIDGLWGRYVRWTVLSLGPVSYRLNGFVAFVTSKALRLLSFIKKGK